MESMSCVSSSHRAARYHVERMVADTGGEQPIYDDSSLQPPRLDAPTHEALILDSGWRH
jgi:hypothetical protein